MQRRVARIGMWLVLCFVGPAQAQSRLTPDVAFSAGVSIPVADGDFTDSWNPGYGFSATLLYRVSERWTVGGDVGYYRHLFDAEAFESRIAPVLPGVNVDGNDSYVLPVTVLGEFNLLAWGTTKPYVSAGLGYYHVAATEPTTSGPGGAQVDLPQIESDSFGARVGIGVRTPLNPSSQLFVDATLHFAFDTSTTFLPIRAGVRF